MLALRPSPRAVRALWAGALLLLAVHVAASLGVGGERLAEAFSTWVYVALLVIAALACLARARVGAPGDRAAWVALGAAPALWAAGELLWMLVLEGREGLGYPSPADALWLAAYPAACLGLVLLIRARVRSLAYLGLALDTAIGAAAVTALVSALLLGPVLAAPATGWARAADLAYPLGDLAVLALVVALIGLTGWRPGVGWALLAAAMALQAVGDAVYVRAIALDTYDGEGPLDTLVPWGWVLIAYAAWWPLPPPAPVQLDRLRVFVLPAASTAVALGLLVYDHVAAINDLAAGLAAAAIALGVARMGVAFRDAQELLRRSRREARTDALTGLANRRALLEDLEARFAPESARPGLLALFDLDGFKRYNDEFGHPAGDVLLARLGRKLADAVATGGRAYRLGGDEFCLLLDAPGSEPVVAGALGALTERGRGFAVASSHGTVALPREAPNPATALQLADRRLYAAKEGRPSSAVRQSRDVLLKVLAEREPDLHEHVTDVTALARGVARRLGLGPDEEDAVARAAELHDIGKMAIPDAILNKPSGLDDAEWAFMRRHPVIGEEILSVAPALRPVAQLVRSHHERWDGTGYPDGTVGAEIPLGARIVAVCDAFSAMTQRRAYSSARTPEVALAELERGAGSHFDPGVVAAFAEELAAVLVVRRVTSRFSGAGR